MDRWSSGLRHRPYKAGIASSNLARSTRFHGLVDQPEDRHLGNLTELVEVRGSNPLQSTLNKII